MNKKNIVLLTCGAMLLLYMGGVSIYYKKKADKLGFMARTNAQLFVREHSQRIGPEDAKVYIVEFFDPACETCAQMYPMVKDILHQNEGKVQLVMRYAPLHEGADYFVKLLEAAKKQDKYFETLELLYSTQSTWAANHHANPDMVWQFLPQAGLDLVKLRQDIDDPAIAKILEQDMSDARELGVSKTPGFFVNGKPLVEFGYEQLVELVNSEIAANY